jgi:hypothetical protein
LNGLELVEVLEEELMGQNQLHQFVILFVQNLVLK